MLYVIIMEYFVDMFLPRGIELPSHESGCIQLAFEKNSLRWRISQSIGVAGSWFVCGIFYFTPF
jgi:hypothetical protein